jgi:predicted Rossmann-fold nucleotide-binding protein
MRRQWLTESELMPGALPPQSVTSGASPYTYTAARAGYVYVSGGTVSLMEFGRNGTFILCGVIAGMVPVAPGDRVRVTYVVAPTMTFVAS